MRAEVHKKQILQKFTHVALTAVALLSATACGREAYKVASSSESTESPGSFSIPPKVDIVMTLDTSGSMYQDLATVQSQIPGLLNGLAGQGWDYHFVAIPTGATSAAASISQVAASKYDPNWGTQWTAPYPGALPFATSTIPSSVLRSADTYSSYSYPLQSAGNEPAFNTLFNTLQTYGASSGFLRSDALLVVLSVSDGDDTSNLLMCTRSDGLTYPCDSNYTTSGLAASLGKILSIKGNSASQIRYYSYVKSGSCQSNMAYSGRRYTMMAQSLGGMSLDMCSSSLSTVLTGISTQLAAQRKAFKTHYLFLSEDADPSTIVVTKYSGGNAYTLPQSATNGWTYAGSKSNIPSVYFIDDKTGQPVWMDNRSGYAIELHGSAELTGDERADITYKPAGYKDSAAK